MAVYIPEGIKAQIANSDRDCCCYCLTTAANSGISLTYDHIQPVSKGGETSFENVCLACRSCNEFKSNLTEAIDPLTGESFTLFNPRKQKWSDHFTWNIDATRVEGKTATGRATVVCLRMNNSVVVVARKRWVISGWHPPL